MSDEAPSSTPGALDDFLCFSVYSTGLAVNRFYKPLLDRLGLTYLQYLLIVLLREKDGQTVSEIGEQLFLESSTLTPLIKRMEAAGHLTRRRDSKDERVVRVSLTDQGRDLAAQAACIPGEVFEGFGMPLEELKTLDGALKILRKKLFEKAK
ncbi:MarR family winged helix-turn-helix transcriptional regulator [Novosphingobium terrae]|uniref:MarR family winged helix-turn-helix transcriptional regulator n=1 Tax=Novosphingobium terrae TaxID=2726189 RepID=UPI00197EA611|nr:MarR family transcriptional regulator [Novosphingobium terrae]